MDKAIKCWDHSLKSLFPKNIPNKKLVYTINIIHILGVLFIQYGMFLPPKYLIYHISYLILIFTSYIILKNRCFMTIISNYYSNQYIKFLCIKMTDAKFLLLLCLFSSVIFKLEPSISPFNIVKKILI